MKITYDYVKEYVESFGYILISKEYINSRTKLDMICDKGHEIFFFDLIYCILYIFFHI